MNVPPDRFASQLEHLLEAGHQFLTVGQAVARARAGTPAPGRQVVLTFDDGFMNLHRNVLPVLARLGVPATVFVATAFMDSAEPFPFDDWGRRHRDQAPPVAWQPLSWAQCRELEQSGLVEIGSHTHTHRNFKGRPEVFSEDLATSLELLERHLGPGPRTFSFPFGSVRRGFAGPELVEVAKAAGVDLLADHRDRAGRPPRQRVRLGPAGGRRARHRGGRGGQAQRPLRLDGRGPRGLPGRVPVLTGPGRMRILQVHTRYRYEGGEDAVVRAEAALLRPRPATRSSRTGREPAGAAGPTAAAMLASPWNPAAARRLRAAPGGPGRTWPTSTTPGSP